MSEIRESVSGFHYPVYELHDEDGRLIERSYESFEDAYEELAKKRHAPPETKPIHL